MVVLAEGEKRRDAQQIGPEVGQRSRARRRHEHVRRDGRRGSEQEALLTKARLHVVALRRRQFDVGVVEWQRPHRGRNRRFHSVETATTIVSE